MSTEKAMRIRLTGGGLAVTIPAAVARESKVRDGDFVIVASLGDGKVGLLRVEVEQNA